MNDGHSTRGSTLGYLAAFTLGVLCMGTAVLVLRNHSPLIEPLREKEASLLVSSQTPASRRIPSRTPLGSPPGSLGSATTSTDWNEPVDATHRQIPSTAGSSSPGMRDSLERGLPNSGKVFVPVQGNAQRVSNANTLISGVAVLLGEPPPEKVLPLDPHSAAKHAVPPTTRFYVTGKDRGLADVIVSVSSGLPGQAWNVPNVPLVLKLEGSIYTDYISAVQTGQPIVVRNMDDILHNLHLTSYENGEFNRTFLPGSPDSHFRFSKPEEFIRFKCDVHPYEFAYVSVFDHPYFAVTDENGLFQIPSLPPGKYMLRAAHRKAGTLEKQVTIGPHQAETIRFDFNVAPPLYAKE